MFPQSREGAKQLVNLNIPTGSGDLKFQISDLRTSGFGIPDRIGRGLSDPVSGDDETAIRPTREIAVQDGPSLSYELENRQLSRFG